MLDVNRKLKENLQEKWNSGKVLIVIGPRQVGKTTLIRLLCEAEGNYLFINGDDAEDRLLLEDAGENKLRMIIGNYKTVFFDERVFINQALQRMIYSSSVTCLYLLIILCPFKVVMPCKK